MVVEAEEGSVEGCWGCEGDEATVELWRRREAEAIRCGSAKLRRIGWMGMARWE